MLGFFRAGKARYRHVSVPGMPDSMSAPTEFVKILLVCTSCGRRVGEMELDLVFGLEPAEGNDPLEWLRVALTDPRQVRFLGDSRSIAPIRAVGTGQKVPGPRTGNSIPEAFAHKQRLMVRISCGDCDRRQDLRWTTIIRGYDRRFGHPTITCMV